MISVSFLNREEMNTCRGTLCCSLGKVNGEWRLLINWGKRQIMSLECSKGNLSSGWWAWWGEGVVHRGLESIKRRGGN